MPRFLPEPHTMFCATLVRKHCCEVLWKAVSWERVWTYVSACHGVALGWLTWFCVGQIFFFLRMNERVDLSSAVKVNFIVKQNVCVWFVFPLCASCSWLFTKSVLPRNMCRTGSKPHKSCMFASVAVIFVSFWWCKHACLFCNVESKDNFRQSQIYCEIKQFFRIEHVFCVFFIVWNGTCCLIAVYFLKIVLE